jgi:hypothetical protein
MHTFAFHVVIILTKNDERNKEERNKKRGIRQGK